MNSNITKIKIKKSSCFIKNYFISLSSLNKTHILCTKKLSGGKSLEKLHEELFKRKFANAHDASVDVSNTYKCYIKLLEKIK